MQYWYMHVSNYVQVNVVLEILLYILYKISKGSICLTHPIKKDDIWFV